MGIISFLVAMLIFTVVVTIHEFGHYLFAKRAGIKVEEFAIGMGPKLFSRTKNETVWSIRALPIGGFCKMYGEDEAIEGDERAFGAKSVFARFLVVIGGPLFNFILAMIIGVVLFSMLGGTLNTTISQFTENSPIKEAGAQIGDEIIAYNGRSVYTFTELIIYINTDNTENATVKVRREGGGIIEYQITPYLGEDGRYLVGFAPEAVAFTNPLQTIEYALREVVFNFRIVVYSLGMMISGQVAADQVSGPVGIVGAITNDVTESAESGINVAWMTVLNWMLLLSTNLGIMNLLPIPALDGGRIMFLIVEAIRRKPMDQDKEGFIHFVGFVLLMALMVLLFYNDLSKLFTS